MYSFRRLRHHITIKFQITDNNGNISITHSNSIRSPYAPLFLFVCSFQANTKLLHEFFKFSSILFFVFVIFHLFHLDFRCCSESRFPLFISKLTGKHIDVFNTENNAINRSNSFRFIFFITVFSFVFPFSQKYHLAGAQREVSDIQFDCFLIYTYILFSFRLIRKTNQTNSYLSLDFIRSIAMKINSFNSFANQLILLKNSDNCQII